MLKGLLAYLLTIFIVLLLFNYFISKDIVDVIYGLDPLHVFISFFLALIIFFISGLQFSSVLLKNNSKKLDIPDLLALPISRSLWGYLIPFQGSLAYTLAFCRLKYNTPIGKGTSTNLYLMLINVFLAGVLGLYSVICKDIVISYPFIAVSITAFFSPLIPLLLYQLLNLCPDFNAKFIVAARQFAEGILNDVKGMIQDVRFTIYMVFLNILHIMACSLWFYWTVFIFDFNLSFLSILFLSIVLKISLLFKITPGNLGVEQLVSGFVITFFNYDMADGVTISMFNKSIAIIISLFLGTIFTINNLKYFPKGIFNYLKTKY